MSAPPATPRLAPATTVGDVHLTVADLDHSLSFYERALGLQLRERGAGRAHLGAGGEDLLVLFEEPGARPVRGHTGLYHFALLLPEREDLARWLAHVARTRVPLTGMSDHLVSEAIYLNDPDGHGIEVYRDRPRAEWPFPDGRLAMDTLPLDARSLLGVLDGADEVAFERMPAGTRMGHVHLHVAEIDDSEAFYDGVLGFDVMARFPGQATFLSAGGYHHHLGANVWAGRGASPPPPGSAALRRATIVLPDAAERDRVAAGAADAGVEVVAVEDGVLLEDPSRNRLLLRAG